MSICIISDHIIMLRQNFIVILSILIKYSPKVGASAPKTHPRDPPLGWTDLFIAIIIAMYGLLTKHPLCVCVCVCVVCV